MIDSRHLSEHDTKLRGVSDPSARSVRLLTLGRAALEVQQPDGRWVEILGPGKPMALMLYVALARNRATTRERLLALLWSNVGPDRGRSALRQMLWYIRRKVAENTIAGRGETVALDIDLSVDVEEFDRCLEAGDVSGALDIYRGPFLPDFAVPGGIEFEHWAELERARLLTTYLHAGETHVRALLEGARLADARRLARDLRDAAPLRESAWRLLLQTLLESGETLVAKLEIDALRQMLETEARTPEPATQVLLDAVRDSARPDTPDSTPQTLRSELIGRDREFARLVQVWREAQRGRGQHVHLQAHAGIGKTRLLGDLEARLRATGAAVVSLRGSSAQQTISYALAAELAMALGHLPGAAGISPAAAGALVALAPPLSALFTSSVDLARGDEALRRRTIALSELVGAVSEESPLAILIDDLHWVEDMSRRVIDGVLARLTADRVLVVTAARPTAVAKVGRPGSLKLELEPLTAPQVEELLTNLGTLPDEPWAHRFSTDLCEAARGAPLLIFETLQLAIDQGALALDEGVWACKAEERLAKHLAKGSALARRIGDLDVQSSELLLLLATAGASLELDALADAAAAAREDVHARLLELEQRGFVARRGDSWESSHDAIAEQVIELTERGALRDAHRRLGRAMFDRYPDQTPALQRAARHLVLGEDGDELPRLFRRFVVVGRRPGDGLRYADLAHRLLGEFATARRVRSLVRSLPIHTRVGLTSRGRIAAATFAVAVVVVALLPRWGGGVAHLAIVTDPLVLAPILSADIGTLGRMIPAPEVELRQDDGMRATEATDSVTARVVDGDGALIAQATVAAVRGRAVFPDLRTPLDARVRLEFLASGYQRVTSDVLEFGPGTFPSRLELTRAVVNDVTLDPESRTLVLAPGDSLTGMVDLRYTSKWPAAAIMLGVTPTWGDRRTAFVTLGPLVTPVEDQPQSVHIAFVAPRDPGVYYLIFAFQAETSVEDVFSGTNWAVGAPVWGDGNDLVDWSPEQIEEANLTGRVRWRWLKTIGMLPDFVPATTLEIVVRARR